MHKARQVSHSEKILILFLIVGFLIVTCLFIVNNQMLSWDFRNNVWAPGYLLLNQRNPFDLSDLFDISGAVWLPPFIGATFYLGLLPERIATNIWAVLNVVAYFSLLALLITPQKPERLWLILGLLGALLFPPFVSTVISGQIGILNMLIWFSSFYFLSKKQAGPAGFLTILSISKPQLLILVGPAMLMMAYRMGKWPLLIRFIAYGALFTILLTIPLWIAYPQWINAYIEALRLMPGYEQPSSLHLLRVYLGNTIGILVWSVFCIGIELTLLRYWKRTKDYRKALIWTLALTPIVAPYTWSWDYVLLMPALIWTLLHLKSPISKTLLCVGYGFVWVATIRIRLLTDGNEIRFWWMSWMILVILGVVWWIDHRIHQKDHAKI
ncbi:DUF2029 domain-containing protein [Phototrophicus methaneseepsis]|uniref:DUF2029 domain-containing protein n=1 Tax=Phototrophicus methaneseepsis TaxID=2710758 RepID=A0A7S8E7P1_9CHLR|nr:glycosyltransferase family 87 protein [Phototrophicus methaneseepsis]QPC81818.1 DUF2029 domain-containing protein [Phototrophicus methaneseepsis]